jgi:hypothetical protein
VFQFVSQSIFVVAGAFLIFAKSNTTFYAALVCNFVAQAMLIVSLAQVAKL